MCVNGYFWIPYVYIFLCVLQNINPFNNLNNKSFSLSLQKLPLTESHPNSSEGQEEHSLVF